MNKFLKLPLFLAVVGGICTTVLATTYSITNPIVIQRAETARLAGYLSAFGLTADDGATAKELDVSADLLAKGITMKVEVSHNGSALGVVYDGSVKGRNGGITFQISFKDGKYNTFKVIGDHCENQGFPGADLLNTLNDKLNGKDATVFTDASQFYNNNDFIASATAQSTANLFPAIVAAAQDYAASL